MKRITNPMEFLYATGLVFRINREILHPMGLSLEVQDGPEGAIIVALTDARECPEKLVYDEESVDIGGELSNDFQRVFGVKAAEERQKSLGWVVQPLPGHLRPS